MSVFAVNYGRLIWQRLPVRLRFPIMWGWLKALCAPVMDMYGLFTAYRAANLYKLAHNSQVCYMEAVLNDVFDMVDRGIYISDPVWRDPLYLYRRSEEKPVWLGLRSEIGIADYAPEVLYTGRETRAATVDFIVNVPVAVTFDTDRMKALVNEYRLPGKVYSIVTF